MDTLTAILRGLRLVGSVFLDAEFSAPWCIGAQVLPEDCQPFMPLPRHLIAYHYVMEGECHFQVADEPPLTVRRGQLLILPGNPLHRLGSSMDLPPADANSLIEHHPGESVARIRHGGGGRKARILCGFLGAEAGSEPLLNALPPLVHLDLTDRATGAWIEGSLRHGLAELAELAGGDSLAAASLNRMTELLFCEAIREYLQQLPPGEAQRLTGTGDATVARVLRLIDGREDHPWTLDEIAQQVGASRSVLHERCQRALGMSPMRYLRQRRLARAAEHLTRTQRPVAEIGFQVGYDSEAAFSRVFKREYGCSPSAFRQGTRREGARVGV